MTKELVTKITLEEIESSLKENLKLNALEMDEFLDKLSEDSEKSKVVLKKRIEELKQEERREFETPEIKEMLQREKNIQELESYKENKINWVDDPFWKKWDLLKQHTKKLWQDNEGNHKWIFLGHSNDTIKGKPQLIEQVQKKIPLIRKVSRKIDLGHGEKMFEDDYIFIDEKFDKRYDGNEKEAFSLDFWLYRIISEDGKEYYIFTQKKLPNETCTFKGMLIEMDDFAEISRSMKVKSLSRIFFMKEFEPSVKILSKEELIEYTKTNNITEEDWLNHLSYHELGTFNSFPMEMEMLRSSFLLCGRTEGWPMHLGIMGPAGTRKTMGHIETISYKFSEDPSIIEGGDSRIKALSPSFKEKPANIGYLARSERIGFVDEIGKMVEFEINKHQTQVSNVLGELNFLLEHKKRTVGSGNDNECQVQANAKFMFVTNPVSNKDTLQAHVGIIDSTTMSRIVWWVQDEDEQKLVLSKDGIVKTPPHISKTSSKLKYAWASDSVGGIGNRGPNNHKITQKTEDLLVKSIKNNTSKPVTPDTFVSYGNDKKSGKNGLLMNRDKFLTLYDTCYSFMTEINDEKIEKLAEMSITLAQEPMKTTVWKPRSRHHIRVIVDGLVKHRCLFRDYDPTFTPKNEDYKLAGKILERMVRSWNTNLKHKVQSGGIL